MSNLLNSKLSEIPFGYACFGKRDSCAFYSPLSSPVLLQYRLTRNHVLKVSDQSSLLLPCKSEPDVIMSRDEAVEGSPFSLPRWIVRAV